MTEFPTIEVMFLCRGKIDVLRLPPSYYIMGILSRLAPLV